MNIFSGFVHNTLFLFLFFPFFLRQLLSIYRIECIYRFFVGFFPLITGKMLVQYSLKSIIFEAMNPLKYCSIYIQHYLPLTAFRCYKSVVCFFFNDISTDAEKSLDKIQYPFLIKILRKPEIKGIFLNLVDSTSIKNT